MARVFKPNDAGFRAMAVSPEVRAVVVAEAERAKTIAEGLAQEFRRTGRYASSFEVTSETVKLTTRAGAHDVAAGQLTNRAPYAAAVEWGNSHDRKPHRVLGRTLDAM